MLEIEPKDTRDLKKSGSFVSLSLPLTAEEIQHQLFEVITRFKFKDEDDIYLYFPKNEKNNFRLFFNNHEFGDHSNIFIGWYPHSRFVSQDKQEILNFAKEIFDEILKLREEEGKNE